jgi:hypothetical protein
MNDETLTAVTRHGKNLLAIFPNAKDKDPVKLCKKLRRIERKARELTTALCNGEEEAGKHEDYLEDVLDDIEKVLSVSSGVIPIFINRDPRGYALKIDSDVVTAQKITIYRDMGGYGIIAPDLTEG